MVCLTSSMDGTLRLWDIGLKKCVKVFGELRKYKSGFLFHKDSIWAIEPNTDFSQIYTGGRDGNIFKVSVLDNSIE